MPPKKKQHTGDVAMASVVTIELQPGEKDAKNVAYHTIVLEAWDMVQDHPLFKKIIEASPLDIKAGGSQAPFCQKDFSRAIKTNGEYTCAVNLAWVNLTWTATPGVPIRTATLYQLRDKVFQEPKGIEQITIAVTNGEFDVLAQKGSLLRVSPEEITSAFILAIARDIAREGPDEVVQKWKHHMLCTNCRFVQLEDQWKRY